MYLGIFHDLIFRNCLCIRSSQIEKTKHSPVPIVTNLGFEAHSLVSENQLPTQDIQKRTSSKDEQH